jgi:hypothetical protein
VPNGFEPEWAQGGDSRRRVFNVGYYGNIMGRRSSTAFLDGLRLWLDERGQRPRAWPCASSAAGSRARPRRSPTAGSRTS